MWNIQSNLLCCLRVCQIPLWMKTWQQEHLQCFSYLRAARPACQSHPWISLWGACSFSQLSLLLPRLPLVVPSGGTWRTWCGTRRTGPTTSPTTSPTWTLEAHLGLVSLEQLPHLNRDFWRVSLVSSSLQQQQPLQLRLQPQLDVEGSSDWDWHVNINFLILSFCQIYIFLWFLSKHSPLHWLTRNSWKNHG